MNRFTYLSPFQGFPKIYEILLERYFLWRLYFGPVTSFHLLWRGEEKSDWYRQTLQGDEYQVCVLETNV